jgi:acyl-ACP thioesterase
MYKLTITPRISEIDVTEKVKITAIMDYLQHIAYKHADQLGVGHHQIFHKNLTWLLLRYTIKITRYPSPDEELTVSSWVAESNSQKYTIRDFEVKDMENNIICQATTSWLLYNYRKRQSLNFKDYWSDFRAEEKRALDYNFPNLPLPNNIASRKQLKVRLQDLDINQHVNHVAHIYWIIESIPKKIRKKYKLVQIEISYKEQAFHEEDIIVESEILEDKKNETLKIIHQVTKNKNKLISKATTYWKSFS